MKAGPGNISSIGFGGNLRRHLQPDDVKAKVAEYLTLGGNFLELVPGIERAIGQAVAGVSRDGIFISSSFPRRMDPYLEDIPIDLKPSVYYTPDNIRIRIATQAELTDEEAAMDPLLFELERHLELTFEESGVSLDLLMLDLDALKLRGDDRLWERAKVVLKAFEAKVLSGEILAYGVHASGFSVPPSDPNFISLLQVLQEAPNLRFISAPLNLCESAFLECVSFAKSRGICVLGTRPLQSVDPEGNGFFLLTPPGTKKTGWELRSELRTAIDHVCQYEVAANVVWEKTPPNPHVDRGDVFWGHACADNPVLIQDPVLWTRVINHRILPFFHRATTTLMLQKDIGQWAAGYRKVCFELFDKMEECCWFNQEARHENLRSELSTLLPLPRLELQALSAAVHSGVDCVLTTEVDAAKGLHGSPPADVSAVKEAFSRCAKFGPRSSSSSSSSS